MTPYKRNSSRVYAKHRRLRVIASPSSALDEHFYLKEYPPRGFGVGTTKFRRRYQAGLSKHLGVPRVDGPMFRYPGEMTRVPKTPVCQRAGNHSSRLRRRLRLLRSGLEPIDRPGADHRVGAHRAGPQPFSRHQLPPRRPMTAPPVLRRSTGGGLPQPGRNADQAEHREGRHQLRRRTQRHQGPDGSDPGRSRCAQARRLARVSGRQVPAFQVAAGPRPGRDDLERWRHPGCHQSARHRDDDAGRQHAACTASACTRPRRRAVRRCNTRAS